MSYFIHNIRFEQLETVLRLYKSQSREEGEVLSFFTNKENQQAVKNVYAGLLPFSAKEALQLTNAEQRMVAMRCIPVEYLATELKAILLDRWTVPKKQTTWNETLQAIPKKYNDTYELYKISARELGLDEWRFRQKGIYFVKCTCPSTNHNFYLYVPPEIGEKRDAIAAIAWTIQIDGVPITRQQYINLMYAEA